MQAEEIFLFVNPKSGGNQGQVFLQVPQPFLVPLREGGTASLRIYSLLVGETGRKPGFLELKKTVDRSSAPVRMVVGGGDGTIMWAVTEAEAVGIDVQKHLYVGVTPLGTGNDFARAAGWGGKNPAGILNNNCALMRSMVQLWFAAKPQNHDVWQVHSQVDADCGDIEVIEDKKFKSMKVNEIKKTMVNYCSFGQDSKIGLRFDRNRTKSQYGNMAMYMMACCAEEGTCCEDNDVTNSLYSLHHGTTEEDPVIFDMDGESGNPEVVGQPEMCIVVNIASYAGGLCHLWGTKAEEDFRSGITPSHPSASSPSDAGDGKLEVVLVPNIAALATDQLLHGAGRVASAGPLHFEFADIVHEDHDVIAYHNVDGEFFRLVNPVSTTITRTRVLQVLHNVRKPGTTLENLNDMMGTGQALVQAQVKQVGMALDQVVSVSQKIGSQVQSATASTWTASKNFVQGV